MSNVVVEYPFESVLGNWIPHAFEFVLARAHPSMHHIPNYPHVRECSCGRWRKPRCLAAQVALQRVYKPEWWEAGAHPQQRVGNTGTVIMASADEVVTERNVVGICNQSVE